MEKKKKVVVAFSGGLDTSFCVPYLKNERGLEVHTVMVNTGGFSDEEARMIVEEGGRSVSLGKTTLRTETAGMAALSMIMYEMELQ